MDEIKSLKEIILKTDSVNSFDEMLNIIDIKKLNIQNECTKIKEYIYKDYPLQKNEKNSKITDNKVVIDSCRNNKRKRTKENNFIYDFSTKTKTNELFNRKTSDTTNFNPMSFKQLKINLNKKTNLLILENKESEKAKTYINSSYSKTNYNDLIFKKNNYLNDHIQIINKGFHINKDKLIKGRKLILDSIKPRYNSKDKFEKEKKTNLDLEKIKEEDFSLNNQYKESDNKKNRKFIRLSVDSLDSLDMKDNNLNLNERNKSNLKVNNFKKDIYGPTLNEFKIKANDLKMITRTNNDNYTIIGEIIDKSKMNFESTNASRNNQIDLTNSDNKTKFFRKGTIDKSLNKEKILMKNNSEIVKAISKIKKIKKLEKDIELNILKNKNTDIKIKDSSSIMNFLRKGKNGNKEKSFNDTKCNYNESYSNILTNEIKERDLINNTEILDLKQVFYTRSIFRSTNKLVKNVNKCNLKFKNIFNKEKKKQIKEKFEKAKKTQLCELDCIKFKPTVKFYKLRRKTVDTNINKENTSIKNSDDPFGKLVGKISCNSALKLDFFFKRIFNYNEKNQSFDYKSN